MITYDKGINLGLSDGNMLVTILGNVDIIINGLDVGPNFGSLDGSFDSSNDGNIDRLLL